MSLTATYVDANAKVTVAVTGAPANATTALLERSTDQVTWTAVRGSQALALTSGAVSVDDYEFVDGVTNYYRATYTDSTAPTYQTSGALATTTSSGSSASVTPVMPSGLVDGDTVYLLLSCTKASAVLGASIAGFTGIWNAGQLALYGARWTSGMTAPTVTWTSLASGDIVMAKLVRYRNAGISTGAGTINVVGQANTAAANIATPANPSTGPAAMRLAYQSATHTSVAPAATTDDHATGYALMAYHGLTAPLTSGTITVTGGSSAISDVLAAVIQPYGAALATQDTGTVTPALSTTWIKNPVAPYLNRAVTLIGIDTVTNPARSGVFDVIERTLPVAVTDLYGGRKSGLTLRFTDDDSFTDVHDCLMTGQTQFVHSPKGARFKTGYFVFGDLGETFPSSTGHARYLAFSVAEVAAPDPSLAAVLGTWQTVISTYATWADLIAAKATWADVLLLVGSPSDVITS